MTAAPSRAPLLSLDAVSYRYPDGTAALDRWSLDLHPGEIVAVIGPSGCGKSTLLALIAGFLAPTSGRVTRAEEVRSAGRGSADKPGIGMVFQKDTVFPWMTVDQNVGFALRQQKLPRAATASRVDKLLELAGLSDARRKYPYQLSGGMRRRVAFLTAMAPSPSLLLLDEPFSALDEPTRVRLHRDVLRILYGEGTTVVLITHDLAEAITLSDRVVICSPRPARVVCEHRFDFARREHDVVALRQDRRYQESYGILWKELQDQIALRGVPV